MNTLQQQQGNKFRRLDDKQRKCRVRFRLSIREFVAKTYYVLQGKARLGAGRIQKIQKGWAGGLPCATHIYLWFQASLSNIEALKYFLGDSAIE